MTTDLLTLGGSEAAAACGIDPFKSTVRLYLEKRGELARPEVEGEYAEWGNRLQPVIAQAVADRGYVTLPAPWHPDEEPLRSAAFPFMHAHPDGFVAEVDRGVWIVGDEQREERELSTGESRGVLEIKTTGHWRRGEWDDDGCPPAYVIQAHHNMTVAGLDWALVACLIGGQRLELRRLDRDPGIEAMMIDLERRFLASVEAGEPPPPDGSDDATDLLRRMFPHSGGKIVVLTADDMPTVEKARRLKREIKAAEAQLAECEQRLKLRLGDAPLAMYDGRPVVRWPEIEAKRLDQQALREELPDVFAQYNRPSSYRRFTLA
jgi:predicted phage-related endonuclease